MINPYLNIEIVDIVAIVKHSVVVRIWQIIWRQLLKHLMMMKVMMMRVTLVLSGVSGGDGGRLEDCVCQRHARLCPLPEVEAGGAGQDLLERPGVLHREQGVVEGRRGFTLVKLQTVEIQLK